MDVRLKQQFTTLWEKYFPGAELPMVFSYSSGNKWGERAKADRKTHCIIDDLAGVRQGKTLVLDVDTTKCGGGKRYLGFSQKLRPDFEFFLSTGIPGKMEGERYKKSPKLVMEQLRRLPTFEAPGKYIVFRRWDMLEVDDEPMVVTFFAAPDVLSGLFSLANFDDPDVNAVIAPSGSGCATIVYYPCIESKSEHPRAVLGMFDVFARPCVDPNILTLSIPIPKFLSMVENMEESFLVTSSWDKVRARIKQ